jgi:hypothetical protein
MAMNEPKNRDDVIGMRLNQLMNNNVGIGITKDSRGLWGHIQASIEILLCILLLLLIVSGLALPVLVIKIVSTPSSFCSCRSVLMLQIAVDRG